MENLVFHIKIVSLKQAKRDTEPCVLPQFIYEEKVSLILGTLLRFTDAFWRVASASGCAKANKYQRTRAQQAVLQG